MKSLKRVKLLIAAVIISFAPIQNSHALVGSALSGGWGTYFYLAGGYMIGGGATCLISDESKLCQRFNDPSGGITGVILGIIALDDQTNVAVFPELSAELIEELELGEDLVESYSKDLAKLRLTASHLENTLNVESEEDFDRAVQAFDVTIRNNFSKNTVAVIEAIRANNAELK